MTSLPDPGSTVPRTEIATMERCEAGVPAQGTRRRKASTDWLRLVALHPLGLSRGRTEVGMKGAPAPQIGAAKRWLKCFAGCLKIESVIEDASAVDVPILDYRQTTFFGDVAHSCGLPPQMWRAPKVPNESNIESEIVVEGDAMEELRSGAKLADIERDHILATLASCEGNRTRAADALGISIRCLRNKLHLYAADGVKVPEPKSAVGPS